MSRHEPTAALPVRLVWHDHDRHPWLAALAATGIGLGGLMAVFGLPPVDLHGPLHYLGLMDPLCGGTRGLRLALQGHLGQAWRYNPLSVALVLGAAVVLIRQAVGAVTGRWLDVHITRPRVVLAVGIALGVLLELNQQANAELLRTPDQRFSPLGMLVSLLVVAVATLATRRRRHRGAA